MVVIACRKTGVWLVLAVALLIALLATSGLRAQTTQDVSSSAVSYLSLESDPENCLSCHRFRGLSRIEEETGNLRLFFCSARYYEERQGPHSRLRCTACHVRDEVAVIPHQVETPVNCTQVCHIVPSTGLEIRFSHQDVADTLKTSAHSPETLADLGFEPAYLRPGQSDCLYCHDQPMFRMPEDVVRPIGQGGMTSRCDHCHGPEMPADTAYYTKHVAARLRPARSMHQLAQICAVCHSDRRIIDKIDSHDTVASYLHSFHGKAHLLGSHETATCIDCHASEDGNVHAMLAADIEASSIHPAQRPSTCRSAECHPSAAPGLSEAAVHLDLDPHARTPEFYVAAMFILLTAAVMSVFFLFVVLELINAAVRPLSKHHRKLIHLASKIKKDPQGRKRLMRLTPHERVQHWFLAVTFILLVFTGMPIKFAEAPWAAATIEVFGGLTRARLIHRVAGVVMIASFFYHIGYLAILYVGRIRANRKEGQPASIVQTILNAKPMLMPRDFIQFGQLYAHLLFLRRERPAFRHFNFMEKFEYWAVFWGIPIMGLSGLALWATAGIAEYVPGRVLNFAYIIHSDEAYLATMYIAVVHMFSVILSPVVFPLSPATFNGQAPAEELVEGHRGTLEEVADQMGYRLEDVAVPERTMTDWAKGFLRRFYSVGLAVATGLIGFASIQFLVLLLLTRPTAPVEIKEIPKRLDAAMLARAHAESSDDHAHEDRPRAPLAHFHQIPDWFEPDPKNNCTTSECHSPLPHSERIEVRAFLNMHSTFVDCGVCHADTTGTSHEAHWLNLPTREVQSPPAVLQLTRLLEEHGDIGRSEARAITPEIVHLLEQAIEEAGWDEQLHEWAAMLRTTHPEGELWQEIVNEVRHGIRSHTHGAYGAKIALMSGDKRLGALNDQQLEAAEEYESTETSLTALQREDLLDQVHAQVSATGVLCTPCHATDPTLIDLDALGYSENRQETLIGNVIVQQILNIEQGTPFYLPLFLDDPGGEP